MDHQTHVAAFIQRWQGVSGSERANYQLFIADLCDLLGVPTPEPAHEHTRDNAYVFERRVTFAHGDGSQSNGYIDCYKRGAFVLEAKKVKAGVHTKGFDDALLRARSQAEGYARALPAAEGRPPFVVAIDVGLFKFIRYIKEELLIVLGTSSSETVLPRMMAKMENLGAKKSVVRLVIQTGYSFNLDGTSIYLTMAAVFIAQATNTPMTLTQQMTLLLVLLLTSKGAAGVTGSGFIVLAATLSAVGQVPVAGLALILGIDRFMSEARALTNLVGNGVATIVVATWTGDIDRARLEQQLSNETEADAAEPEAVLDPVEQHMLPSRTR